METMLHRIIGDDVSVGIKLATDLAPVEADRAQIERVILNLAANARDAMPDGGALTIETANVEVDAEQVASHGDDGIAGPHVLLAVSDTGHGMDEDVAKHLFEPFFTTKGAGDRHGARARDGVRRRQAERRRDLRLQRARPRHDVQDLPARSPRASADAGEPRARAGARGRHGDDHGRRGRRRRPRPRAADARGQRLRGAHGARRRRGRARLHRAPVRRRPAADRRDDARGQRPRPGRAARRAGARDADPVHVRLLRRGRPPPRRARRPSAAFLEKPFTERTLARKVREVLDAT